jgi:hypothetical protein
MRSAWFPKATEDVEQRRSTNQIQRYPALVPSELSQAKEGAMRKCLVVAAGTLAILALALLVPNRVDAGASASAPSKNTHVSQSNSHNYPISEYSSSSRKHSK